MSFQLGIVSILLLCWRIDFVYSENVDSSYIFYQRPVYPRDCKEARDSCNMQSSNGVIMIKPDGYHEPFEVYCDHEVDSGGWTVFQRRVDGSVNFFVDWEDYKNGFGPLNHEHWLGNEKIFSLTNQRRYALRIDFVNSLGDPYFAKYDFFSIDNEINNYRLTVEGYSDGDAGDSLTGYNNNENFSTRDRDNDDDPNYHYALNDDNSAWWYGGNDYYNYADSVLNGGYHQRNKPFWETLPHSYVNIQYTEMKIRPA
ncbi:Fibrinogen-like protein A [Holothuria leucospilota]|uniref:Fibrinogen-like protein A n=1 Tax=Holothuria leucospilota TaxID=206669 RepID=A0A9Q1BWD7_HOLLE|nr:Fibrinogen-like protein A [Holothuria leucospilota]